MSYEGYGQSKLFEENYAWRAGQPATVLRWPPEQGEQEDPRLARLFRLYEPSVYTLMLGLKRADTSAAGRQVWRWNLQLGVGGARQAFQIDAIGSQLISVPLEAAEISILSEAVNSDTAYQAPTYAITAYAYIARGTTATDAARYTTFSPHIAAGDFEQIIPPVGATGFRIHGDGAGIGSTGTFSSPFTADVTYALSLAGGGVVDSWYGDEMAVLHRGGGYIPVLGGARVLTIQNNGGLSTEAAIVWEIDF